MLYDGINMVLFLFFDDFFSLMCNNEEEYELNKKIAKTQHRKMCDRGCFPKINEYLQIEMRN